MSREHPAFPIAVVVLSFPRIDTDHNNQRYTYSEYSDHPWFFPISTLPLKMVWLCRQYSRCLGERDETEFPLLLSLSVFRFLEMNKP